MILKYRLEDEAPGSEGGEGAGGSGGENTAPAQVQDWKSVIPEEYRELDLVRDAKDVNTFMSRVKENREFRSNSVRLPSENASDEERSQARDKLLKHFESDLMLRPDFENPEQSKAFYQTMGMPEEPSGYEMPEVGDLKVPEEREASYRQAAHELGLTKKQFNGLMARALEIDAGTLEAQQEALKEGTAGLRADWGAAFDERTETVKKFVQDRLPSLDADILPPQAMKELWNLASQAYAGGSQMDSGHAESGHVSPSEAKEQLGELMRNKEFMEALRDHNHPGHQAAKAKKTKLYKEASTGPNGEYVEFSIYG